MEDIMNLEFIIKNDDIFIKCVVKLLALAMGI